MTMTIWRSCLWLVLSAAFIAPSSLAKKKDAENKSLAEYLSRAEVSSHAAYAPTAGSLWTDSGRLADMVTDYKARHIGDLLRILIVQDTTATNTANVGTDRSFKASSGIDALGGHISNSGV
jgi:flagellar L-ring protein precursor FlgH